MIKKTYQKLGQVANFLSKPLSRLVLNKTVRTRAMIVCDNQTILVKNWLGKGEWSLPGGGISKNETAEDCIIREIDEEVGVSISLKGLKHLGQKVHPESKQNLHFKIEYFFVQLKNKPNLKIKRSWEITEANWFNVKNLPEPTSLVVNTAIELASKASLLP